MSEKEKQQLQQEWEEAARKRDTAAMQVELLELELAGVVARLPGGLFQRMGNA